ncbi:hypothetical protein CA14_006241 [Aspergillus flavus]|uniref:Uncharacterized protein n=1 Tax=Aspergillus flavus TaxID=5059 RepID=A0AB74BPT7_ASPFL|nr:hypothetical protein CA14_006241 [Aspergillus flavus]
MTDIQKHSSDLLKFRQTFSFPRLRQTLRRLYYEIDLPASSARHKERDVNDKAFEKDIMDLFNELSTWDKQGINLQVATSSYKNLGNVDLPELPYIRALYIPDVRRNPHPSMIGWIISSLPRLETLMLKLNAPPPKNKELQKEYRLALAKALDSPSLSNLRSLYLSLTESVLLNHSYETQTEDPAYPDGDSLNLSIRKLAETSPLATISLTGFINEAMLTYDGRWYYTGNPSSVICRFPLGTNETEWGQAMLNGQQPWHQWRTEPDPEMLNALMKSMAEAMNRMPRLLRLEFCMAMYLTDNPEIVFTYSETRPAR